MNNIQSIGIFGIKISVVDTSTTLNTIENFIESGTPHLVVTADSSCVVMAQDDPDLKAIVNSADLVTPDGTGILWAAKRFGTPVPERVSGVDIVEDLCARGSTKGYRVFLLGSAPGIAEAAGRKLAERYPGLTVAGTHHGFFGEDETADVVTKVRDAKPDVLFVAMGIPRQEKWIHRHMQELAVPVSMGVGGTFDVISGQVKRAPGWMQRRGIEWVYRLLSNPRKIKKVMTLPVFAMMVLRAGHRR